MKYVVLLLILISACTSTTAEFADEQKISEEVQQIDIDEDPSIIENIDSSWLNTELTNVNTDETYRLSDFSGQKVLIESFAVWCPTCTKQQEILKTMEGDVIHVSIGTDPNEDEIKLKEHALSKGFDWYYSVAPKEFTQSWIEEFGIGIINAPRVPMILLCEDQSYRKLADGLKTVKDLQDEIIKGC